MNARLRTIVCASVLAAAALPAVGQVGIFESASEVGIAPKAGKTELMPAPVNTALPAVGPTSGALLTPSSTCRRRCPAMSRSPPMCASPA